MATKYEEELEKAKLQEEKPIQQPQQPQQQSTLKGVSENTQQQLGVLSQGYQPSQNVNAAQQYLQGLIDKKPGEFNSQYAPQITQLYDQIMNRGKFKYDVNADPLWQQYKNAYMQGGQQAMQDTVGTMAGMTGGYGNSFAGAAGQQQYQEYLKQMTGMIPQLQAQAYDRYQQEGQDLQNLLGITQALEETEYGRHRDTVADWMNDRNFAQGAYESAYDRDYQNYANMLNYWQQQGQLENKDYWTDQEFGMAERSAAFDQAIAMIQMGMSPSAELLTLAGLTEADAEAYRALLNGSRSGGGKNTSKPTGTVVLNGKVYNMADLGVDIIGREFNQEGLPMNQYSAEMYNAEEAAAKAWGMTVDQYREHLKKENEKAKASREETEALLMGMTVDQYKAYKNEEKAKTNANKVQLNHPKTDNEILDSWMNEDGIDAVSYADYYDAEYRKKYNIK